MQSIKNIIAAFAVVASLAPFTAMAHQGEVQTNPALGSAVSTHAATRTIVISLATRFVNVDQGDVVTFELDGGMFTWQFDTLRDSTSFELSAIAPAGVNTHGVRVYVAPSRLYSN